MSEPCHPGQRGRGCPPQPSACHTGPIYVSLRLGGWGQGESWHGLGQAAFCHILTPTTGQILHLPVPSSPSLCKVGIMSTYKAPRTKPGTRDVLQAYLLLWLSSSITDATYCPIASEAHETQYLSLSKRQLLNGIHIFPKKVHEMYQLVDGMVLNITHHRGNANQNHN